ncbi:hypothetical protein M2394_005761 [Pseudomonas sp. BIGb0164]|nr:hypothetical protein [Pseudomonas sp. BIGb0164]
MTNVMGWLKPDEEQPIASVLVTCAEAHGLAKPFWEASFA